MDEAAILLSSPGSSASGHSNSDQQLAKPRTCGKRCCEREVWLWLYPLAWYFMVLVGHAFAGNALSQYIYHHVYHGDDDRARHSLDQPLTDSLLPHYVRRMKIPVEEEILVDVADALAYLSMILAGVFSLALRDRHMYAVVVGIDSLLVIGKACARSMTILPDSGGPEYCDNLLSDINSYSYFGWIFRLEYRYCSDMMWSGHVQHLVGGCWVGYRLFWRHRKALPGYNKPCCPVLFHMLFFIICTSIPAVGTFFFIVTRSHYSVDMFVALLVTFLAYENQHLRTLFARIFLAPDKNILRDQQASAWSEYKNAEEMAYGDFPRTHSIVEKVNELQNATNDVSDFLRRNAGFIELRQLGTEQADQADSPPPASQLPKALVDTLLGNAETCCTRSCDAGCCYCCSSEKEQRARAETRVLELFRAAEMIENARKLILKDKASEHVALMRQTSEDLFATAHSSPVRTHRQSGEAATQPPGEFESNPNSVMYFF